MPDSVTLRSFEAELRDEDYPLDRETVLDEHGDTVLDLPGGEESVADALGRVQAGDFHDHAGVVAALETGLGGDGVGRRHYTDRGGTAGPGHRVSF
ncbi:MAG: hypothetical protein ABEH83_04700 [Halobacterium sp.]